MNAIIEEFFKTYNSDVKIKKLNQNDLKQIPELNNYYQFLKSKEWILGETPKFKHQLTERFDWAFVDLHLDTDQGKISKAKLFTDCLDTQLVEEIQNNLHNLDYHSEKICTGLDCIKEKLPHTQNQINEFQNWLKREIK
jgi:lipoate-protein ligase A